MPPQVDAARLRKTITARMPDAWLIQNSGLNPAATESADGKKTYVHLFKPPKGNTFSLPLPADGRRFSSARIIGKRGRVRLNQNETGIIITVKSTDRWDDVDTIIELH